MLSSRKAAWQFRSANQLSKLNTRCALEQMQLVYPKGRIGRKRPNRTKFLCKTNARMRVAWLPLRLHRNSAQPIRTRSQSKVPSALWIVQNPGTSPSSIVCLISIQISNSFSHSLICSSQSHHCPHTITLLNLPWPNFRLVAVHFFLCHTSHFQKPLSQPRLGLRHPVHSKILSCLHLANPRLAQRQATNGQRKRTRSESCIKHRIYHLKQ